ncbi:phytanoyl-CoA dioxygenase family protein [Pseudahrensia aquimaris]|uniref:Phytanoyl-CoA dioxygenase family protein n=1 Tax=Pseudahrensia aquimaris TaxID=744461 RepID=A0ABW3FIZ7_9HYPH
MLEPAQIEFFNAHGYLVVDDVLDQERVLNPVRAEYAALMNTLYDDWFAQGLLPAPPVGLGFTDKLRIAYEAGCDWFQPMDISLPGDRIAADTPMHFGPAVFNMVTNARLLDVVESLIGPEITSNPIQHVRIKPPAARLLDEEIRAHITATDWHQDRAVALEEADATQMITVWCAITDATVDNGCLQVIPKTADETMKVHCPKSQTSIAPGEIDISRALPLPVKSGGVVIFHPLTPHASLVNTTDDFRWSFDLRYNVTGQPTGRSHFPEFVARSRSAPVSELRSSDKWRALWDAARTRLAKSPHIDIHRWGDSPACA